MRVSFRLFLFAVIALGCRGNESSSGILGSELKTSEANSVQTRVDQIVHAHIAANHAVGASIGIVDSGKHRIASYGVTNVDLRTAPAHDTLYELASISKVFTGILLSGLVHEVDERFRVHLDDPISKYLDGLTNPNTANITLLELVTHTSGLPTIPDNLLQVAPIFAPYAGYTAELLLEFLNNHDGIDNSVEQHPRSYSNLGMGLLGYVLTQRTGLSFDELLHKYVTGPLGMKDTVTTMSKSQKARYATPYFSFLDEGERADFGVLLGNGAMVSTVEDMMKFITANLNPDSTPIASVLKFAQGVHHRDGVSHMGLGWFIDEIEGVFHHQHAGGNSFFNTYLTIDKSRGLGYVVLANTGSKIQCLRETIMMGAECEPEFGVEVPEETLRQYVGRYQHDSSPAAMIIELTRGFLTYESVGSEKGRLTAKADGSFTVLNAFSMRFHSVVDGRASEMSIQQGDTTFVFRRSDID